MSIEGDFVVRFGSSAGEGGGVLTLSEGKAFGGDSYMYYVGSYEQDGKQLKANVRIGRHIQGGETVFGQLFDQTHKEFNVVVKGSVAGELIQGEGFVEEAPGHKLRVTLKKLV